MYTIYNIELYRCNINSEENVGKLEFENNKDAFIER